MAADDPQLRQDVITSERLNEIQREIAGWARRSVTILAVICAVFVLSATVSTYLWLEIKQTKRDACIDQNNRHADAIRNLDNILDEAVSEGDLKPEDKAGVRGSNVLLINAILPVKQC